VLTGCYMGIECEERYSFVGVIGKQLTVGRCILVSCMLIGGEWI